MTFAPFTKGLAEATVTVEFSPGSEILAACIEAVRLACVLGCTVRFDFNGVQCLARPTTDPHALADRWQRELQRPPAAYKVAS